MYSFLRRYVWEGGRAINGRLDLRRLAKATGPLAAVEPKQKQLEFVNDDIIDDSIGTGSRSLPIIEESIDKKSAKIGRIVEQPIVERTKLETSPLAFEDIPGPSLLKILEKYWKYVPILGTQLICGLLVNNLTQGKLTFSRNFVPMEYIFDIYGPIVRINGPMIGDIVMIHRPDHIAEVLSQEGESPVRSAIDVLQHYRCEHRKYRLPGLISMQGKEWLETRSKFKEPLIEQISKKFSRLDAICDEFVQRIRKTRNRQDEVPSDFDKPLSRWGMECFSVLMFDRRLGFLDTNIANSHSELSAVIEALSTAHLYMSKCETGFQVWRFFETPYYKKMCEACDVIDNFVNKYIREAQNNLSSVENENSSILEKLLGNGRMHPEDISAVLMDSVLLGVQAMISSQAFLLYFLARNPRVQRKLYDEVCACVRESGGSSWTEKSFAEMTYLKACIQESLRLRPAFPCISRVTPKTINLHGYTIPKGTCLIMASEISSQREENFEDPTKFMPERWLGENSKDDAWQKFSSVPFGHGIRSCLGKSMAETKLMLLTAKLVHEFRIEYDYAPIESKHLTVSVPSKPLKFRFVDRRENWRELSRDASAP